MPKVGDVIFVRMEVVAGPHPDGGFWCLPVDAAGVHLIPRKPGHAGRTGVAPRIVLDSEVVLTPAFPPATLGRRPLRAPMRLRSKVGA
jgi:hypothetical protein